MNAQYDIGMPYHSNNEGCLKSLNTASPQWLPFYVRYKICCIKTWRLFSSSWNPCWTYVANSNSIVLYHREKLPDRRRRVQKCWRNECETSWESLQFKAAVTCTRKAEESQINQADWLTSKRTLSNLDIGFHLFIGAIKVTSFSPISVNNLSVR